MIMREIRGKKANENRWNALKLCDWAKDQRVIERIFNTTNPLFFSNRTPQEIIDAIKQEIVEDDFFEALYASKKA